MRTSARNSLPGIIRKIELGAVNAEVTLEIAPGIEIVSIITAHAVENLGLKQGQKAFAVIKGARERYDGIPRPPIPRSPWCEVECGGH